MGSQTFLVHKFVDQDPFLTNGYRWHKCNNIPPFGPENKIKGRLILSHNFLHTDRNVAKFYIVDTYCSRSLHFWGYFDKILILSGVPRGTTPMQNRKLSDFGENMRISQAFEQILMVLPSKQHRKLQFCLGNYITRLILPRKHIFEPGVALRMPYTADIHSADPQGRE